MKLQAVCRGLAQRLCRAAIASLWEPHGAEYVEGTQFRGHEELDARIAHAYEEFVASGKYNVTMTDDVSRHDDIIAFTVQLSSEAGQVAWAAASSSCSATEATSVRITS